MVFAFEASMCMVIIPVICVPSINDEHSANERNTSHVFSEFLWVSGERAAYSTNNNSSIIVV